MCLLAIQILTHSLLNYLTLTSFYWVTHCLGVVGAVLSLVLFLLQLDHLYTLLLLTNSYFLTLCPGIFLLHFLHPYLALDDRCASILLTRCVILVDHLYLTYWSLLLHHFLLHQCLAVILVFSNILTHRHLGWHHLLHHLHLALLHVDGVTEATLLLLHLHTG